MIVQYLATMGGLALFKVSPKALKRKYQGQSELLVYSYLTSVLLALILTFCKNAQAHLRQGPRNAVCRSCSSTRSTLSCRLGRTLKVKEQEI